MYFGDSTEAWTLTSGSASVSVNRPITAGDHFRIGSQTKTFTSVVVLQLVDEGLVDLDTPVERYLPGALTGNYDGDVITPRQAPTPWPSWSPRRWTSHRSPRRARRSTTRTSPTRCSAC